MASVRDRVRSAKRDIMLAAFERWVGHWPQREEKQRLIAHAGPGSADAPRRSRAFQARESVRARLALERMIGDSWDATIYAPSEDARRVARPVARIVEWGGDGFQPVGIATGFMVSPTLLLTNWHVIPRDIYAKRLYANFGFETTDRGTTAGSLFALDSETFFLAYEYLDYALVAVQPQGNNGTTLNDMGTVRLIDADGKIRTGDPVNIIQHPEGGPRQWATTNNRLTDILEAEGFLHYEADTLRGSSGSPVYNDHWELVGLHHCGVPAMRGSDILKTDGTAWDPENDDEKDVEWVANEGARVSFILADLKARHLPNASHQALLDQLLSQSADPLSTAAAERGFTSMPGAGTVAIPAIEGAMPHNIFNITGGTNTIHAEAPPPPAAAPVAPVERPRVSAPPVAPEKAQNFDPDYSARPGYDASFLGVVVPIPEPDATIREELYSAGDYRAYAERKRNVPELDVGDLADDDPLLIAYHNYSLVTSKRFRMPLFTASNVDYSEEARRDPRNRQDFGGESWRQDPRVPREFQLIGSDIYDPAKNFDRGHIVRREDNAWGPPGIATEFANADTYHWTNCTPQHELFNQENPKGPEYSGRKGIWGRFEGALQQEIVAGGGQAVIFAGPVLYSDTRTRDFGNGDVTYPLKFWKVIVVPRSPAQRPDLLVYGFVFDQSRAIDEFGVGLTLEEALRLEPFSRQARSLAKISELTGLTFADALHAADQHAE